MRLYLKMVILFTCSLVGLLPLIAQLVERRTVVVSQKISSGRWFDSGSADFFDVVVRTQKNHNRVVKIHRITILHMNAYYFLILRVVRRLFFLVMVRRTIG